MDERLRALERQARAGDPSAKQAWLEALRRQEGAWVEVKRSSTSTLFLRSDMIDITDQVEVHASMPVVVALVARIDPWPSMVVSKTTREPGPWLSTWSIRWTMEGKGEAAPEILAGREGLPLVLVHGTPPKNPPSVQTCYLIDTGEP